ncbi:MAG: winged helix DNA-binding protein [Oscillospiraceae bacterium]|nr:winged helix DNA-binding protein [Oscillospiraceae bacterium]
MKNDPQELARSIVVSAEKVKNYSVQFSKLGDLAYNEMLIIDYLAEFGDAPQKDIAKYHAISKQTINLSVKSLIKDGYVDLYQSLDNKKEKILKLTDKGNVMKRYSMFSRSKQYAEIIDTFGLEKAALLEILLKEYETIIGKVLTEAMEKDKEKKRRFRILEKNEIEAWEGNRK